MSTHAHSESSATVYSQIARAASTFSDTLTSLMGGSALPTRWMEAGLESPSPGSPLVVKGCTRLDAEVTLLRKRLNSEMALLPIVQSTNGGGLTCEFMFPIARGSPPQSPFTSPPTSGLCNGSQDRARTETPREVDDPEDVEEACVPGFASAVEHSRVIASPSEDITVTAEMDPNYDWFPSRLSVLSDGSRSSDHGWAVGEGVEEVPMRDHYVLDKMGEDEQDNVLECENSQSGEQAVEDEEFTSSIGALVKWAHRAPPFPVGTTALEEMDGYYNSTACTLGSKRYPSGDIALTASGILTVFGLRDILVFSPVNIWPSHRARILPSPRSSPEHLGDASQHTSMARRLRNVKLFSSPDSPSLRGAW
ncbi:hypothetical protein TRAPUB_1016 [Trametes pubescens]|uniref:Uncharacterized protein n=1 Tax=Trametes pubescens TaxID=154538 RepID=A0A1M2VKC5_TRAPU|nr:hypothetical protein TRAPUB_1016 [Trametes pubescens]